MRFSLVDQDVKQQNNTQIHCKSDNKFQNGAAQFDVFGITTKKEVTVKCMRVTRNNDQQIDVCNVRRWFTGF